MKNTDLLKIAYRINTHESFYSYWLQQLTDPKNRHLSKIQIFDEANALYKKIFKTKKGKYSSYNSFQRKLSYLNN